MRREERFFLAWFGVRGIGSLYYATAAAAIGGLALESEVTIVWTAWVCVLCSVVVHGVSGAPFSRRLIERAEHSPKTEGR